MIAEKINQFRDHSWRFYPHTFARRISHKEWNPYEYLVQISHAIVKEIFNTDFKNRKDIIIVNVPPQHGKSEFISKYVPAWFLEMFPNWSVALTSYESDFAAEWGGKVRDLIAESHECSVQLKPDIKARNKWNTTKGGGMVTAGAGGAITGRGFNLFIIDDPYKNWEEASSELIRRKVKNWFKTVALTRKRRGCLYVILQTRWHEDDLSGWLLDEYPHRVQKLVFPAFAEKPNKENNFQKDMLSRKPGEVLCEELHNKQELNQQLEILQDFFFNAMFQQRPAPMEGNIVKWAYIKYWKALPARFDEVFSSWDMAFKKTQSSSFVCGQIWGRIGAEAWLIDQVRERMDFVETCKAFRALHAKYPNCRAKLVEDKANGPAIMSQLKSLVTGMIAVQVKGSKEARFAATSPQWQAGNVWIPDPSVAPWVNDYIQEIIKHPNAKNDDQADTTSQALDHVHEKAIKNYKSMVTM